MTAAAFVRRFYHSHKYIIKRGFVKAPTGGEKGDKEGEMSGFVPGIGE